MTSPLSLVHTSDISIRTRSQQKQSVISPQGLAKIKQEFFFVSSFLSSALGLYLDYDLMLMITTILMSQA